MGLLGILLALVLHRKRLRKPRESMDAGANAAVLPALSVASLLGFGSVVAALPAFEQVREWVLLIEGGPLVSLAVATNVLAALTGSASGGLTIALQALGGTYLQLSVATGSAFGSFQAGIRAGRRSGCRRPRIALARHGQQLQLLAANPDGFLVAALDCGAQVQHCLAVLLLFSDAGGNGHGDPCPCSRRLHKRVCPLPGRPRR